MLYDKLTNKDIDTFCSYVQNYGPSCDSNCYGTMATSEHILRVWESNKNEYLFKAFGEQLILEREVEFAQPRHEIRSNISYALEFNGELHPFYRAYVDAVAEEFGKFTDEYYFLLRLVQSDNLADNIAHSVPNNHIVSFKNGQSLRLDNTAKTMKLLGKVAKNLNLTDEFEQFRLKHSLLLNKKKIKGTLCLSIHPMDFLTMSDNANGWTSCMTWRDDGDYRAGTVEMMNSRCVIVAYMKSKDRILNWDNHKYEWNSKLWRTLIVVDPKMIISVKNYPYAHDEATKYCINWLRELAVKNLNWDFSSTIKELPEEQYFEYDGKKCKYYTHTNEMYNDFGSACHFGVLHNDFEDFYEFNYSGPGECMCCGSVDCNNLYEDHNFVFCRNCCDNHDDTHVHCDECGEYCYQDDVYWVEDTPLCGYCFDKLAGVCEITGDYLFRDNMSEVYLARIDDAPADEDDSILVGDYFIRRNSRTLFVYFNDSKPKYDEESHLYYWNISDLTETGLRRFFYAASQNEAEYRNQASRERLVKDEE